MRMFPFLWQLSKPSYGRSGVPKGSSMHAISDNLKSSMCHACMSIRVPYQWHSSQPLVSHLSVARKHIIYQNKSNNVGIIAAVQVR